MTTPPEAEAIPDEVMELALKFTPCFSTGKYCHHESDQSCEDGCEWRQSIVDAVMADRRISNAPDTGETWRPIATADKNAPSLMLGIFRQDDLREIHIGGYRYAFNDDEVSCWWSDQADDEICPTHWLPLPGSASPAPAASPACGGEAEPGLTLAMLQRAHVERQEEWCPDQKPDLSFRGNEMAGEVGEACNVIKKLERERHGWRGSRATKEQLAEELADVIHTATLCAITAGIDIEPATVAKFNATSEKNGLAHRICSAPPSPEQGGCLQDVVAMSADPESRRVLKLHFNRDVTDEDRQRLCALHNAVASPEQGEVVRCALTEARRFVEAERDQRGESDVLYPIPTTLVLAQIDAALAKIGGAK